MVNFMPAKGTYLVAGGSGAIGSGLLGLLLDDVNVDRIYATSRNPCAQRHPKLEWLHLDYRDPESTSSVANLLCKRLDRLAGFICATGELHGEFGQPEKTIAGWDANAAERSFLINALGPLQLFSQCSPLLKKSQRPIAMFLSAQIGSIDDNAIGGWISYRMAKAALNMGIKTAAIEAQRWRNGAAVVAVHPGTTHSMLSAPFVRHRKNVSDANETAHRLYRLSDCISSADNGTFINSHGQPLAW